jgi:hypothetical protein
MAVDNRAATIVAVAQLRRLDEVMTASLPLASV